MSKQKKCHVIAKQWYDRVNGNCYFSVRIFNEEGTAFLWLPYQNGYGDAYLSAAAEALELEWPYSDRIGIHIKVERCTKAEVKEWGKYESA